MGPFRASREKTKNPGFSPKFYPQIEEKALQPGNTPTSSISETGWKPILHCAVASSRWVREGAFRCTRIIARPSGEQCSIGFQPVFVRTSERCFQVSAVSPNFKLLRRYLLQMSKLQGPSGRKNGAKHKQSLELSLPHSTFHLAVFGDPSFRPPSIRSVPRSAHRRWRRGEQPLFCVGRSGLRMHRSPRRQG